MYVYPFTFLQIRLSSVSRSQQISVLFSYLYLSTTSAIHSSCLVATYYFYFYFIFNIATELIKLIFYKQNIKQLYKWAEKIVKSIIMKKQPTKKLERNKRYGVSWNETFENCFAN